MFACWISSTKDVDGYLQYTFTFSWRRDLFLSVRTLHTNTMITSLLKVREWNGELDAAGICGNS